MGTCGRRNSVVITIPFSSGHPFRAAGQVMEYDHFEEETFQSPHHRVISSVNMKCEICGSDMFQFPIHRVSQLPDVFVPCFLLCLKQLRGNGTELSISSRRRYAMLSKINCRPMPDGIDAYRRQALRISPVGCSPTRQIPAEIHSTKFVEGWPIRGS